MLKLCTIILNLFLILVDSYSSSDTTTLYHIIPSFTIFHKLAPISQSWLLSIKYFFISPSVLWLSFSSYSYRVPISNLKQFHILHLLHVPTILFFVVVYMYLTTSSPFINFCNSLLPPTLPYNEMVHISSLTSVFQKLINYLCSVQYPGYTCTDHYWPYQCHADLPSSIFVNYFRDH